MNFTFSEYSHKSLHVKFARNSHEIRTNFVRIYVNFFRLHANHTREGCLREGDGRNLAMTASPIQQVLYLTPCRGPRNHSIC